jgi:hypothetical protein
MPLSVNECNLREAYTIAPTEVRQGGNVYVPENPDSESEPSVIFRTPAVG